MNLKLRFSLLFSFLFSALLGAVMLVVYYLFANFRSEEYKQRLLQKAETTVKLLLEVDEVSIQLLRIIDEYSINPLYHEKTIILNDSLQILYSSVGDTAIQYTMDDIRAIQKHGVVFKRGKNSDVIGLHYDSVGNDYYVLVSAQDRYVLRRLIYLKYLLIGAFLVGTSLVWILSFYLSKKNLEPLDRVRKRIQEITAKNLNTRLEESKRDDEINALSHSFNQMMDRIDKAYNRQKEFTANASHELRTPIARIVTQLENILKNKSLDPYTEKVLKSVSEDCYQLSDIVASLLLLSEIDNKGSKKVFKKVRLDEVIFSTASQLNRIYPDFKLQFEISNTSTKDVDIEIEGDETLLKVVLVNLFKNGYLYSDTKSINCKLRQNLHSIQIIITNTGEVPNVKDTNQLFNTFARGSNTYNKPGSGIGLSIVHRVLQYHNAIIVYNKHDNILNEVVLTFST